MIPSPCKQICKVEGTQCIGCLRSLDEIRKWRNYHPLTKVVIWIKLLYKRFWNGWYA